MQDLMTYIVQWIMFALLEQKCKYVSVSSNDFCFGIQPVSAEKTLLFNQSQQLEQE